MSPFFFIGGRMTKEEFIKHLEEQDFSFISCPNGCYADVIVIDKKTDEIIGYESLPYDEGCDPDCFIEALQYIKDDPVALEPVYGIIGYKRI